MDDVGDGAGGGGGGGSEGVCGFVEGGGDKGWGEGGLEKEGKGEDEEEEGADEGFGVVHDAMVLEESREQ